MHRPVGIFYAYWAREWDVDFLPFLDRAKALGFELLELHAAVLEGRDASYRLKIRERAQKLGLALSYGMGLDKSHDLSSMDETVRLRGVAYMKRIIKAVAETGGCGLPPMIGGTVHGYWPAVFPEGAQSKLPMLAQSLKSMAELAPFAEELGVKLNVEVINRFEQFLVNTCGEALAYVEKVDSPACNILLDTFHMNIEEDSIGGAIRAAGKRLASLHLGEPNRRPPGLGRMPWGEVKAALDDIGYSGPLVMEPFVVPGGSVGRSIGVWREIGKEAELDELAEKSAIFVKENLR